MLINFFHIIQQICESCFLLTKALMGYHTLNSQEIYFAQKLLAE